MWIEYYTLEFKPDVFGEEHPAKENRLGVRGLSTMTNTNLQRSINRRIATDRMISQTFQAPKAKQLMIAIIQRQ